MVIRLEDINNGNKGHLFIGTRSRLASATSVKLLDPERLVVCSLAGQRMYLMRYDFPRGTYHIQSCIATQYHGEDVCTDLMDFDGRELIVTSNSDHDSASLYRVANDQLLWLKDIPIRDSSSAFCHGARFVPGAPETVCVTCVRGDRNVYFISTETTEIVYQFGHGQWRPHDACFLDSRHMIVLFEKGKPTKGTKRPYQAKAALVSFDLVNRTHEFVGQAVFPEAHMDCCRADGGTLYINNQNRDTVVVCRLEGDKIVFEREIPGYNFPHGLDVLPGANLLAVTNYGDNTIVLTQL